MNSYRALYVCVLISVMFSASCGGGANGSNPNNVTVAVSPMSATIPASGEVTLQATVKGSPGAPSAIWFIAELATNGASGAQCNWSGTTQPAGPCPDGTIERRGCFFLTDREVPCSQHCGYVPRHCAVVHCVQSGGG